MTSSKDNIDEKDEGGTQPPKEETIVRLLVLKRQNRYL